MTDPLQLAFDDFLRRSIAMPGLSRHVDATGIRLHYLEWPGPAGAPTVLLLHGFLAHAHWWDFIAPWLAQDYRVIAPDFGGMGDSGYRPVYQHEQFVAEIAAVIGHTGSGPCIGVGHSFGGRALLHACAQHPQLFTQGIIVDSRLSSTDDPLRAFDAAWRPKIRYPSQAVILGRFSLRPDEPAPAAALAHMAQASVKQDGDAWVWKFDEQMTRLFHDHRDLPGGGDEATVLAARLRTPLTVIRGEWSKVVTDERGRRLVQSLPTARGPLVLPSSYHHIPVSQPLALLGTLRGLLLSTLPQPGHQNR